MISEFYGKKFELEELREKSFISREGVSMLGISQAAEDIGFRTMIVKADIESLLSECPLPAILHWNQDHFIVLYRVRSRRLNKIEFTIADPAYGMQKIDRGTFEMCWLAGSAKGAALLLEPTADFYKIQKEAKKINGWRTLFKYLRPFYSQIVKLCTFLALSTIIALAFPFFTQYLIDEGVMKKDFHIVTLLILSQLVLFISGNALDIVRSRLLIRINAKISLYIVSDFLKKLLSLPIRFFDSKSVGDVSQRIVDHHRIETFLTGDLINSFFSIVQIIVFTAVLFYYGISIALIFTLFSLFGIGWILLFQKKRKKLDYIRFNRSKVTQEKLHELIVGMQEIKLFGNEDTKRWDWQFIQQKLYRLNIKSLSLEQIQQTGFIFLTYIKNILITYTTAIAVMQDTLSLGIMLSVSYIIGQTNAPLEQLVDFFKSGQNARLSLNRMIEVQEKESETDNSNSEIDHSLIEIPEEIRIENVSFQYHGPRSPFVLRNVSCTIAKGKVTAIVGASGSGKTTLIKLLLGFYRPVEGKVTVSGYPIDQLNPVWWRNQCGTVMQEGFIFYDTIEKNIAFDGEEIDDKRFKRATSIGNLDEFVNVLPMKYKTMVGVNGLGLSGGQRQRILIARAVYKDPSFLFLDEATSSLDANNEKWIMSELNSFFKNKTVVIIAHRLSTVKNADKIIVLEKGMIKESGTHNELALKRHTYFELIKNQLELGE